MKHTWWTHKRPIQFWLAAQPFKLTQVLLDILTFNSGLGNLLDERCEGLRPLSGNSY